MTDSNLQRGIDQIERKLVVLSNYVVASKHALLDREYSTLLLNRTIQCIVCGYSGKRDGFNTHIDQCQFGGGRLERYYCNHCDALFGPMKILDMSAAELAAEYALLYSNYSESNSTALEVRTFKALSPTSEGLYLNWGCGLWSDTINILRSQNVNVWGYEPNAPATSGYIVSRREEISALFDGIFSNNVVEHLIDPVAVFKDMGSILRPRGVMAHSTPCYSLAHTNTRFHTLFLLGNSAEFLARSSGFEIIDREYDGEYMNIVFRKRD
jgi:SAM-dependent methyltransferase